MRAVCKILMRIKGFKRCLLLGKDRCPVGVDRFVNLSYAFFILKDGTLKQLEKKDIFTFNQDFILFLR
jgi:hypothetical protein